MDKIKKEEDDEEVELSDYVEHDKNYFFVHLAEISCKLCDFKGKLIVQHYRAKHPESEVLISRIDPDITQILIEDAIRNREEYDKTHPKLKTKRNFKCPFCLVIFNIIPNTYYSHISSHTGEYRFRCNHCSYWIYNDVKMRTHLNEKHYKIHKKGYKKVYPDPEILKYVFGYICSECNFIQLIRATVEEHAMVYHPGKPEIHRVNLGILLHSNEKKVTELSILSSQVEELEEVKVKVQPEVLDDLHPVKKSLRTYVNTRKAKMKEREKVHLGNNEPENTSEEVKKQNEKVNPFEQLEEAKKSVEAFKNAYNSSITNELQKQLTPLLTFQDVFSNVLEIGPISVTKESNIFTFHCKIQNCNYASEDQKAFGTHCEVIHNDFVYIFGTEECSVCSIKFEYKGKFVTVHDVYLHIVTVHNDFFKPKSIPLTPPKYDCNLSELVEPYNCEDDGFPSCPFKTLYFDEYLKHVEVIHQVNGLDSSERESPREAIMEGWLTKEVGPFQCRYCKKATVTHQEMARHHAVFHTQKQCWFYYRKFVPNDAVIIPEQVNLEDPSFINHVIHLPNQVHLCDFKLKDDLLSSTSTELNRVSKALLPLLPQEPLRNPENDSDQLQEPLELDEVFSNLSDDVAGLLDESDLLCLNDEVPKVQKKLQCKWEDCYQTYLSQTALVNHIEKDHVKFQRCCFWNNCPRKSEPYSSTHHLLMHMRVHTGEKPNKCPFPGCDRAFSKMQTLKVHQRSHTGERPYLCQFPNCLRSFSDSSHRSKHMRTHDIKLYACQVTGCPKKYTNPNSLRTHVKNHTVDEQLEIKRKLVENKQKSYYAQKKLSSSSDTAGDEMIHHNICEWEGCFRTFHSQMALVEHIEKNHIELKGGEEFTCFWNNCPRELKPYSTRQNLLFHMRIHSGEKPNKCEFQGCKEAFTRLEALKIHQRKHTGERPYLCQFTNCFKSFTCSTHRSKHMRTHYDTKPYACKVIGCSKRYAYSSNLWTHMFTHTIDEQLEVKRKSAENKQKEGHFVQKRVYKSSDRVKQQRTQHYIKSYVCHVAGCSSRFGYPSKLWKHMKTHTVNDQLEFKRKSVENKQGKNLSFILYQI